MSDRTAPAAPVAEAALRRTALVRVPGTSLATLARLPDLLDPDIDRLLGELW